MNIYYLPLLYPFRTFFSDKTIGKSLNLFISYIYNFSFTHMWTYFFITGIFMILSHVFCEFLDLKMINRLKYIVICNIFRFVKWGGISLKDYGIASTCVRIVEHSCVFLPCCLLSMLLLLLLLLLLFLFDGKDGEIDRKQLIIILSYETWNIRTD